MKRNLRIGWFAVMMFLLSCSTNEELGRSKTQALSFDTFVSKGTRAVPKTAFKAGDDFGVVAYVHMAPWADGIDKTKLMHNQQVIKKNDNTWGYSPLCYWEETKMHTFLAYSPYNQKYRIEECVIQNAEVPSKTTEQVDLLYSLPEADSKDQVWSQGKQVLLTFRHALSQVKFSIRTDQDYSGYYTATVTGIRIKGINNAGKLNLNAKDATTSPWSDMGYTSNYYAQTGTLDVGVSETLVPLNTGNEVFMLLPQDIAENAATFEFVLDITATTAGNATMAGSGKILSVKIPAVTWIHNKIYHYQIDMSLQQLLGLQPIEVGEPEVVEWETGTVVRLPEDLTIRIPGTGGDTDQSGKGETTLGVTKSNQAGQEQEIYVDNPEKSDQWIASVGAEITTTKSTRADAEIIPADWVRISKTSNGTGVTKIYGLESGEIYISLLSENQTLTPRKAEVLIKRALTGTTHIVVTQAPAKAAIIEANTTQFKIAGGANQLTVKNESNVEWTLSKTDAPWLTLNDQADGSGTEVTSGTATQTIYAIAQANTTTAARKATITLAQKDQTPVTIEVTQAVAQATTLSASALLFVNTGAAKTLTITNPEYAVNGFGWKLSTTADWLQIGKTSSTENVVPVTITAAANPTGAARSGEILLTRAGQSDVKIPVTQDAPLPATLTASGSITNLPATGATAVVKLANPAPQLTWTLTSSSTWMSGWTTPGNSISGTGGGNLNLKLEDNTTSSPRSATLTLSRAGQADVVLTVTQQAAGPATLSMTSASFDYAGGSGSVTVTIPAGQSGWKLASNAAWLTVAASSVESTQNVNFTAAKNNTGATRAGVITLSRSGQSTTLTVVQTGVAPITIKSLYSIRNGYMEGSLSNGVVYFYKTGNGLAIFEMNNPNPELPFTVSIDNPLMTVQQGGAGQQVCVAAVRTATNNTQDVYLGMLTISRAGMEDIIIPVVQLNRDTK